MIAGTTYLLHGKPVVAIVAWRQQRKTERITGPLLDLKATSPRNVMVRFPDGSTTVRPFRGLRRAGGDA